MSRSICPVKRNRCQYPEVCHLLGCSRSVARGDLGVPRPIHRPIAERELTKEERYRLHIAEQRALAETLERGR